MKTFNILEDLRVEVMNGHFTKYFVDEPGHYVAPGVDFIADKPGVIHRFAAADGPDADPHDHPWPFTSTIIVGGYAEEIFDPASGYVEKHMRLPGDTFEVTAETVHRIVRLGADVCWTFIQPGPDAGRPSGFYRFSYGVTRHRYWFEDQWSVWPRVGGK